MLRSIKCLNTGASARVRTTQGFSKSFKQDKGLRQGCVLAPTMFNLFIRDLSFALDSSPKVQLDQMLIDHLLYADDLVLCAHSEATLQQLLDKYLGSHVLVER